MIAVTLFFATVLALSMHGALVLSATQPQGRPGGQNTGTRRHVFPRPDRLLGRHPGHPPPGVCSWRLAGVWFGIVCIVVSGPFWTGAWPEWWGWWLNMPICGQLKRTRRHTMAQYQNLFTSVQPVGPLHDGVPLPKGDRRRSGTPFLVHLLGRIGNAANRPGLPRHTGLCIAAVWHVCLQHHRLQHAGVGGLEPRSS